MTVSASVLYQAVLFRPSDKLDRREASDVRISTDVCMVPRQLFAETIFKFLNMVKELK